MPPPTPVAAARPLAHRAAISSLAVLGSRMLGLVREQVFAYFFGAGREYDAFLTAFRIPNLLRDLLAEGALSTAFVTVFSGELADKGRPRAFAVANAVGTLLALLLGLLVLVGMFAAPQLVHVMAVGFDPDKAALTVLLTRLMFPFIFFVALAALAMGMLNAQGYFALPQSASSFFNITSIFVGLAGAFALAPQYMWGLLVAHDRAPLATAHAPVPVAALAPAGWAMVGMALGTLMGGLVQGAVQLPLLWRLGWRPRPRTAFRDPAVQRVLQLLAPATVGAAAVQLSVFVNSNFASTLGDRAISWLSYSFRLMQFPIGVFGVAIMSASLPTLSRQARQKDAAGFGQTLTQALELVLFLTVPAAIGLALLGAPLVRLVFEHGRFHAADTAACANALSAYAVGLPGYSALKVLQPAFVARGDAKTPMVVTLVGVAATIGLNAVFVFVLHFGHVGLALSTSTLATGSTLALLFLLERRAPTLARARLFTQSGRILLAAAGMAGVLSFAHAAVASHPAAAGARGAAAQLCVLGPLALAVYVALGRALRVDTVTMAHDMVRRRLRRPR